MSTKKNLRTVAQEPPQEDSAPKEEKKSIMEIETMGETNLTDKIKPTAAPYALHGFGDYEVYEIDFGALSALGAGTYDLVELPVGRAFLGGYVIVTASAGTSGTIQFELDDITTKTKTINPKEGSVTSLDVGNDGTVISKLSGDKGSVLKAVTTDTFTDLQIILAVKSVDCNAFKAQQLG